MYFSEILVNPLATEDVYRRDMKWRPKYGTVYDLGPTGQLFTFIFRPVGKTVRDTS